MPPAPILKGLGTLNQEATMIIKNPRYKGFLLIL